MMGGGELNGESPLRKVNRCNVKSNQEDPGKLVEGQNKQEINTIVSWFSHYPFYRWNTHRESL